MTLLALISSFLTRIVTLLANFVRYHASSAALSPHQITTRCFSRKIGNQPSHTAHAETQFCQYVSSPGNQRRFAVAQVEIITVLARYSLDHTITLCGVSSGFSENTTESTVFVRISVQL